MGHEIRRQTPDGVQTHARTAVDLHAYFTGTTATDTNQALLANLTRAHAWIMADSLATSARLSPQARLKAYQERQARPYSDPLSQIVALADAVGMTREQVTGGAGTEATAVTLVEGKASDVEAGIRHAHILLTGEAPDPDQRPVDPVLLPEWGVKVDFSLEALDGPNGMYKSTATVSAIS